MMLSDSESLSGLLLLQRARNRTLAKEVIQGRVEAGEIHIGKWGFLRRREYKAALKIEKQRSSSRMARTVAHGLG
jgi:hypothetical protein